MKLVVLAVCALVGFLPCVLGATPQLRDIEDLGVPEETPIVQGRMFRSLDESQSFYVTSDEVVRDDQQTTHFGDFAFNYALPCVAASVGVAGYVTYMRSHQSAYDKLIA